MFHFAERAEKCPYFCPSPPPPRKINFEVVDSDSRCKEFFFSPTLGVVYHVVQNDAVETVGNLKCCTGRIVRCFLNQHPRYYSTFRKSHLKWHWKKDTLIFYLNLIMRNITNKDKCALRNVSLTNKKVIIWFPIHLYELWETVRLYNLHLHCTYSVLNLATDKKQKIRHKIDLFLFYKLVQYLLLYKIMYQLISRTLQYVYNFLVHQ